MNPYRRLFIGAAAVCAMLAMAARIFQEFLNAALDLIQWQDIARIHRWGSFGGYPVRSSRPARSQASLGAENVARDCRRAFAVAALQIGAEHPDPVGTFWNGSIIVESSRRRSPRLHSGDAGSAGLQPKHTNVLFPKTFIERPSSTCLWFPQKKQLLMVQEFAPAKGDPA